MIFSHCAKDSWHKQVDWDEVNYSNLPVQSDFPESEAVVLLDEGSVEIIAQETFAYSIYERHTIKKLFNSRGDRLANVVIPYGSQSTVEDIEARTISPSGQITVLDPENIYDVNLYPNFVFYSDQRAKIFTLPAIEDNCVIEYRYRISIRSRTYGSFWRFQDTVPVKLSRFTVTKPAPWELDYRLYDLNIMPQKVIIAAGRTDALIWEARDMDAITPEVAMPPMNQLGARLLLRPVGVDSWQDISRWYSELVETQMDASDEIIDTVLELTAGKNSDRAKLKAIFEWVRDQVRYIAVSIGMGGYQPHPVDQIMRNKYGDCKDMTTLLCTMAQIAGIDMYQALISTANNGIPDTTLPSAVHFNHVIAYAPDVMPTGTWMDCTEKTAAFGQLPWYDQGVPVLLVKPDGSGQIVTTPHTSAAQNRSLMSWQIQLNRNGSARVKGRTSAWGTVANELREQLYLATRSEIEEWLERYLEERAAGSELLSFNVSGLNPVQDSLYIDYQFTSSHFARRVDNNLIILPDNINRFDLFRFFHTEQRMQAIQFQFLSQREVKLHISYPDSFLCLDRIRTDSLITEFGAYHRDFKEVSGGVNLAYRYKISVKTVPALKYKELKEFIEAVHVNDLDELVLEPQRSAGTYNLDEIMKNTLK